MKSKDSPMIEMANGDALPEGPRPEATGHPGENLDQPILADPIPVPAPVAAAASASKKTVEHWARAKAMLPEFTEGRKAPGARPAAPAPLVHNPKFAMFHAAKHSNGWPIGMELTEAEFDAAVADAQAHVYR